MMSGRVVKMFFKEKEEGVKYEVWIEGICIIVRIEKSEGIEMNFIIE